MVLSASVSTFPWGRDMSLSCKVRMTCPIALTNGNMAGLQVNKPNMPQQPCFSYRAKQRAEVRFKNALVGQAR
jgi:hypothetical protein